MYKSMQVMRKDRPNQINRSSTVNMLRDTARVAGGIHQTPIYKLAQGLPYGDYENAANLLNKLHKKSSTILRKLPKSCGDKRISLKKEANQIQKELANLIKAIENSQ